MKFLTKVHAFVEGLFHISLVGCAIGALNLVWFLIAGSVFIKAEWAGLVNLLAPVVAGQCGLLLALLRLFVRRTVPEGFELFWSFFGLIAMGFFTAGIAIPDHSLCWNGARLDCFVEGGRFAFDQFSKGALADVFDVFSLKLSNLNLDQQSWIFKYWVLIFRTYSGAYFLELIVAMVRGAIGRQTHPKNDT